MRLKVLILILFSYLNICNAQKSLQYSSFFQGRHFQFVIKFTETDKIYGHCIDFQDKSIHKIEGKIISPGYIIELNCTDHTLFRHIRLKEDVNITSNLSGFYYAPDGYIGHVNFSRRTEELNFEENKDIETVNNLYRLLPEDFGIKPHKTSAPFLHDPESGLYILNSDNGYSSIRGIPSNPRKLILAEGLLHSFQEQKIEFNDGEYKHKIHFQVLGYTPYHSVLVISEENDSKISTVGDTTYMMKYKIAVYTFKAKDGDQKESWVNETEKLLHADSEAIIKEKFPHCTLNIHQKFLELSFYRKCRITIAIPKTIIYVPELTGSTKNKTLIFNWQNAKLNIE